MKKIAVDFGSGTTKIYIPGCGVVLCEATCAAVEEYEENGQTVFGVKALGDKARALSGRAAVNTHIVNPVVEGDIKHEKLAAALLKYFLEKIELGGTRAKRVEAIFTLPCGIKSQIKQKYVRLSQNCGIGASYFTFVPFAAVLGHNVSLGESTPVFSLDIGQSVTNIAAFSKDGIISGLSVNLGGGNIDVHLIDELAEGNNFKIGTLTAERLKNTVGSLLEDDNKMLVIDGRQISNGAPVSLAVNSSQIYDVITTYVDKILDYATLVISELPAEVASAVMRGGVYLSGGVAKMDGLPEYIEKKLSIPVNVAEEPRLAAVIGAGTILSSDDLLDAFASVET